MLISKLTRVLMCILDMVAVKNIMISISLTIGVKDLSSYVRGALVGSKKNIGRSNLNRLTSSLHWDLRSKLGRFFLLERGWYQRGPNGPWSHPINPNSLTHQLKGKTPCIGHNCPLGGRVVQYFLYLL